MGRDTSHCLLMRTMRDVVVLEISVPWQETSTSESVEAVLKKLEGLTGSVERLEQVLEQRQMGSMAIEYVSKKSGGGSNASAAASAASPDEKNGRASRCPLQVLERVPSRVFEILHPTQRCPLIRNSKTLQLGAAAVTILT